MYLKSRHRVTSLGTLLLILGHNNSLMLGLLKNKDAKFFHICFKKLQKLTVMLLKVSKSRNKNWNSQFFQKTPEKLSRELLG